MARSESPRFFAGKLLLALPGMGDPHFDHAVIAMISHDEDGAMGIAIDQPGDMPVSAVIADESIDGRFDPDPPVMIGGPVEQQRGFVVHSSDWGGEGTIDVAGRFSVSLSLDVLRAIAGGRGPSRWLLAMGYAGWGPGQLEAEIAGDSWHVTDIDRTILFDLAPESRWAAVMARDGIDPARIVARGGHA
jgi:putative transcriptional regulator